MRVPKFVNQLVSQLRALMRINPAFETFIKLILTIVITCRRDK